MLKGLIWIVRKVLCENLTVIDTVVEHSSFIINAFFSFELTLVRNLLQLKEKNVASTASVSFN